MTVGYAAAYSFKYSARPGTPAATMEDQIPRDVMDDRLQRLQARINTHQLAFNRVEGRHRHADPDRAHRPPRRPDDRQVALAAVGPSRDATREPGDMHRCDPGRRRPQQHGRRGPPARSPPDGPPRPRRRPPATAPGSSSSSTSRICSGRCSAITTATWSRSRSGSASISPRAATRCRSRARPTPRPAPATC